MQHVHTGETGADDYGIEPASLLQLGVLIRHAFSDVLSLSKSSRCPSVEAMTRHVSPVAPNEHHR
jgi:hypothetical protein